MIEKVVSFISDLYLQKGKNSHNLIVGKRYFYKNYTLWGKIAGISL